MVSCAIATPTSHVRTARAVASTPGRKKKKILEKCVTTRVCIGPKQTSDDDDDSLKISWPDPNTHTPTSVPRRLPHHAVCHVRCAILRLKSDV
eukprot:522794-Rhodomonas_salina.2